MATKKSGKSAFPVSDRTIGNLVQVFHLLGDQNRLRVLIALSREGEMNVSSICEILGQSQPAVSHHLTLLRMAGLVAFRREGKFNYYSLDGLNLAHTLEAVFSEAGKSNKIDMGDFQLTYQRKKK